MAMPKHEQRLYLGIDHGVKVYRLLGIGPMVDKLEDAALPTNVATPPPLLLENPTFPTVLFSLRVWLPPPTTLDATNATPDI